MGMENALVKKGLTGHTIKIIGIILMFICHINQMFFMYGVPAWLDWFGRPVAIIFLFFCAEGFAYTRSRTKYLLRLLIGFELMYVVSMQLSKAVPSQTMLMNSIFGTLFLAALLMFAADMILNGVKAKRGGKIACGILLLLSPVIATAVVNELIAQVLNGAIPFWAIPFIGAIPSFVTVEGSFIFPLLGLLFYLLRKDGFKARLIQLIHLAVFCIYSAVIGSTEWMAIFAAIPLLLYNGERGKGSKYFFYIFYPAHIYGLYLISWAIGQIINNA